MDENGRLAVPAKLRKMRPIGISSKKQVKSYILAKWLDGCLGLFIPDEWTKKLEALFAERASMDRRQRVLMRHLSPNAYPVTPDSQGRITVPKDLILDAKLGNEVLISGATQHIEIWNPDEFKKFLSNNISFEKTTDQLFGS
jgi:MraZ protein